VENSTHPLNLLLVNLFGLFNLLTPLPKALNIKHIICSLYHYDQHSYFHERAQGDYAWPNALILLLCIQLAPKMHEMHLCNSSKQLAIKLLKN
jgi:hypothetical protein